MRLTADRRLSRAMRLLPRYSIYSITEIVLLSLLAMQGARLLFVAITPVGPVGAWRVADNMGAGASPAIFGMFDPFFRLSQSGGPVVVTALNITLYGIRADQASGRGSAIIGLPDGTQASYAVGEEIMPGVTLKSVAFDSVTIDRGGTSEQVYLDMSQPAAIAAPTGNPSAIMSPLATPVPPPVTGGTTGASALAAETQVTPRMDRGVVTGFTLQPRGGGQAFGAAGFQPGDTVVSVNGTRVTSSGDADRLQQQMSQGGEIAVEVERGGRVVSLRVKANK